MIVVPEIDMPGHTHAVGLAYPELAEAPVLNDAMLEQAKGEGIAAPWPARPTKASSVGFSSLKIHDEATYDFLADVFGELAAMTPGPYLHLGGDESLGTDPDDFALFVARASEIIADLGKTPIAWHEAGEARRHRRLDDRSVLGLPDPDRRHGREGARVRRQRLAAHPLARPTRSTST